MSEYAAVPMPPENNEEMLVSGLIVMLQYHKENAAALQANQLDAHNKAGQPLRAANYVVDSLNDESRHIPSKHRRVVFGPQHAQAVRHDVARLIVRYPEITEDFYPENNLGQAWNDIFIEAQNAAGETQDYLLNSKGLKPFGDAQIDVVEDAAYDETSDLFTVYHEVPSRALLSLEVLNDLLRMNTHDYEGYVYQLQANDEEVPATSKY